MILHSYGLISRRLFLGLIIGLTMAGVAQAAVITNIADGNWSVAETWDAGVPLAEDSVVISAGKTVVVDVDTNAISGLTLNNNSILNQSANTLTSRGSWNIGQGSNGTYNLSGGTVNKTATTTNQTLRIGRSGYTGTLNMSGTTGVGAGGAVLNVTGDEFTLGEGGRTEGTTYIDSVGVLNMSGDSQLNFTTGSNTTWTNFYAARGRSSATWTMTDNAKFVNNRTGGNTVLGGGSWWGDGGGTATLTMSGNSQFITDRELFIGMGRNGGANDHSVGIVTLNGNASMSINNQWISVGRDGGIGELTVNGGSVIRSGGGTFAIGIWGDATGEWRSKGTVTLNGGTIDAGGDLVIGFSSGSTGIVHLNGGLLKANYVGQNFWGASGADSTLHFNGGTLQSTRDSWEYINSGIKLNVKNGGAKIDSQTFDIGVFGALTEDATSTGGGLTKLGTGRLRLQGVNTYTGATLVNSGTLTLNGTGEINASSSITVNGTGAKFVQNNTTTAVSPTVTITNGTLDGTGTVNTVVVGNSLDNIIANGDGGTGTLTIGSLTFNGAANVNINAPDAATPGILTTSLATNAAGKVKINASKTYWEPNTYNMIGYTDLTGAGFSGFELGTIGGINGTRQDISLLNSGGFIQLKVDGTPLTWTGEASNNWTVTPVGTPYNWSATKGGNEFLNNDSVLFNDNMLGAYSVDIRGNTDVAPASVVFATSAGYVIDSTSTTPHGITGTGFVIINGTGSVTINTTNTYTGGTTLSLGTLNLGNASALGTGALKITGGTIDNTTTGSLTLANTVNANGNFSFGGLGQDLVLTDVILSGNRTITVPGGDTTPKLLVSGVVSGAGYQLIKSGAGTLVLSGANTYTGETRVEEGTLSVTGGTTGVNTANIRVRATGSTATLKTSGAAVLNTNWLGVGDGTIGNLDMSGTSSLTCTGEIWIGQGASGNGTVTLSDTATLASNNWFCVARDGGTGTLTMDGGTINKTGGGNFIVGSLGGQGTVNQNSGTINNNAILVLGENTGANANFVLGNGVGSTALVQATSVESWNAGSVGNLYFNGGTLQATADSTNYTRGTGNDTDGYATLNLYVRTGGAVIDSNSHNITIQSMINSGETTPTLDGGLTKIGTGTLTLTGDNYYTGPTVVSNGTLAVTGSGAIRSSVITVNGGTMAMLGGSTLAPSSGSASISVNGPGAKFVFNSTNSLTSSYPVTVTQGTLDGTGLIDTVTVQNGTGIVANGNGTTGVLNVNALTFEGTGALSLNSDLTNPALAVNTLTTSATPDSVTVNASSVSWPNGTYNLVSYTGSINFAAFTEGTFTGKANRQTATLTNPAGFIAVQIYGDTPIWTGVASGAWTTTPVGPAYNWVLQDTNADTEFMDTDAVVFNDDATGTTLLDISNANIAPSSSTFNNSSKNYTISSTGGFGITSGAIIKSGTGSLTITTANTYGNGTVLNAGTININNASAIGTGALTINDGTLDNTSGAAITLSTNNAQNWKGNFAFGGTKDLNLGTGAVTMQAGLTPVITTNGSAQLTVGGIISGDGGITKAGLGTLVLNGANTYTGATSINAGTVVVGNDAALGTNAAVTIANGATLDLMRSNLVSKTVSVQGSGVGGVGAIISNGTGGNQLFALRYVTLTGDTTFGGTFSAGDGGRWDIRGDAWDGSPRGTLSTGGNAYNLTKVGTNQVSICGIDIDPALGDITINGGVLGLEASTTGLNSTNIITVNAGGTLMYGWGDTSATGTTNRALTLNGGRINAGNDLVTYQGPVNVTSAGAFLGAGAVVNDEGATTGRLTLANNVTVTGGGLLTKQGAGDLTINGILSSTGDVSIGTGLFQINTAGTSTAGNISGSATSTLGIGTDISNTILNATSVSVNTLKIGAGSKLVIAPLSGGPLAGAASLSAVPEPSTWAMLMLAAMGLGMYWRRSR